MHGWVSIALPIQSILASIPFFSGWWFHPLWKILVSWDDYSQYMGKSKSCSSHHQPTLAVQIPQFRWQNTDFRCRKPYVPPGATPQKEPLPAPARLREPGHRSTAGTWRWVPMGAPMGPSEGVIFRVKEWQKWVVWQWSMMVKKR